MTRYSSASFFDGTTHVARPQPPRSFQNVETMCPPSTADGKNQPAVVVVDPLSTGALISSKAFERGYQVVRLWSSDCPEELRAHTSPTAKECFFATLEHDGGMSTDALDVTACALKSLGVRIDAILCGSEPGVILSDSLAEHMGLPGNGTTLSHVRRNKYNQSEAVRASGLRAVEQALVTSAAEAAAFLDVYRPEPFRIIVKPVESAGSEDVKLCHSREEVFNHVEQVMGRDSNALGLKNDAVLVQEFLSGTEYIVDFVTRNGDHKCVAVWEYDKRPANGGSFVYFGQRPMSVDSPTARVLVDYVRNVLGALGISNGATHSEVMLAADGEPCLVECNCRTHGGNGEWEPVIEPLIGYTQVSALLDAFLDAAAFDSLPEAPQPFAKFGILAFLASYKEGRLFAAPGFDACAERLTSFRGGSLEVALGGHVVRTINVFTELGVVQLVHDDRAVVEEEYALLHRMCASDAFIVVVDEAGEPVSHHSTPPPAPASALPPVPRVRKAPPTAVVEVAPMSTVGKVPAAPHMVAVSLSCQ